MISTLLLLVLESLATLFPFFVTADARRPATAEAVCPGLAEADVPKLRAHP